MKNSKDAHARVQSSLISPNDQLWQKVTNTNSTEKQKPVWLQMVFFSQHEIGSHVGLFSVLADTRWLTAVYFVVSSFFKKALLACSRFPLMSVCDADI